MNIQELIHELQKFPWDKEVVIRSENEEYYLKVNGIEGDFRFVYFDDEVSDCIVLTLQKEEKANKFDIRKYLTPERTLIGLMILLLLIVGIFI